MLKNGAKLGAVSESAMVGCDTSINSTKANGRGYCLTVYIGLVAERYLLRMTICLKLRDRKRLPLRGGEAVEDTMFGGRSIDGRTIETSLQGSPKKIRLPFLIAFDHSIPIHYKRVGKVANLPHMMCFMIQALLT